MAINNMSDGGTLRNIANSGVEDFHYCLSLIKFTAILMRVNNNNFFSVIHIVFSSMHRVPSGHERLWFSIFPNPRDSLQIFHFTFRKY